MRWNDTEDDADDLDDLEDPDESDMDDSDEPELVSCPCCRKSINEEAERCHHCGSYLVSQDPGQPRSRWVKLTLAVILILVMILVLVTFA